MFRANNQTSEETMEPDLEGFDEKTDPVVIRRVPMHCKIIFFTWGIFLTVVVTTLFCFVGSSHATNSLLHRRWGGFQDRPMTDKCYQQERTAMLLNLFVGWLGVDQFYAHHWALGVVKLVVGAFSWVPTVLGFILSSKGHNTSSVVMGVLGGLGLAVSPLWIVIDMVLWIVGGIYGTPGCPI